MGATLGVVEGTAEGVNVTGVKVGGFTGVELGEAVGTVVGRVEGFTEGTALG